MNNDVPLTLTKGEINRRILRILDEFRRPLDLTALTLTFLVRERGGTTDLVSVALSNNSPATAGLATVVISASDLSGLEDERQYEYRVQTQAPTTLIRGPLSIRERWG